MKRFDEQLLRLKQSLGLTKDAEIAVALGLSKAALSNRKRSGSFPEDKVVLLKRTHPGLDVMYVLTGERWSTDELVMHEVMATGAASHGDKSLAGSIARMARNEVQALKDAANDAQVRELLRLLIFCDRAAIAQVALLAGRLMGPHPMPFAEREPANTELLGVRSKGEVSARRSPAVQASKYSPGDSSLAVKPKVARRKA